MYVIDTNVIMRDCFFHKKFSKCLIPLTVIRELEAHKTDQGETGKNVRTFFGMLPELSNVEIIYEAHIEAYDMTNDEKIMQYALEKDYILVTGDRAMLVVARAIGCRVQDASKLEDVTESDNLEVTVNLYDVEEIDDEIVIMYKDEVVTNDGVSGIKGKNTEQIMALDALSRPNIELVILEGVAGTGKTLLAVAASIDQVCSSNKYEGVTIARPTVTMGEELGFLPGTLEEKLRPFLNPILDNLRVVTGGKEAAEALMKSDLIEAESLGHIRGRSIAKRFMIIDEAQNCTIHDIKAILTRAGEGTKIVLVGDPNQIDNPKCNKVDNGITYVLNKFKDQEVFSYIKLVKGERSRLAELSAKLL